MDVLVYSADGSTGASHPKFLDSLRHVLVPNYAVAPVTSQVILKQPWMKSCAMLVVSGQDFPQLCRDLGSDGTTLIRQFVRDGGAFLGINAGGYYGSARFEGDSGGDGPAALALGFFPGVCRERSIAQGASPSLAKIETRALDAAGLPQDLRLYSNGGGVFLDSDKFATDHQFEVLARFAHESSVERGGTAAIVYCRAGEGNCVLASPHLELDPRYLAPDPGFASNLATLLEHDGARIRLLQHCISRLGLKVNKEGSTLPSLSTMYISSADLSLDIGELIDPWQEVMEGDFILDEHDTFFIRKQSDDQQDINTNHDSMSLEIDRAAIQTSSQAGTKNTIVCDQAHPTVKDAPMFDHDKFFACLRRHQGSEYTQRVWFGRYLMYGEVMESTNTILASNHKFLRLLPTGFTALASLQTAGRGRGSNVWVSPLGCLLFSTLVRHPSSSNETSPMWFVQYIASIAIIEAVKSYAEGYQDFPIKIKWPNDIYVQVPGAAEPKLEKIGGILVQCTGFGEEYYLVVGIGLNTTNTSPRTSLRCVVDALNVDRIGKALPVLEPPSLEKVLARILQRFEQLYIDFRMHGWEGTVQEQYLKHWLHSGQIVTIESVPGAPRGRILGISSESADLRVEELSSEGDDQPTGRTYELRPDGNSFDFFHGLLKTKA